VKRVGDGRGFVIAPRGHPRRLCLPEEPPAIAGEDERTYAALVELPGESTSARGVQSSTRFPIFVRAESNDERQNEG
jgi:hypothetical protein